ncbi:hypothetical protein A8W25_28320 [Streptomyces sp. ERV7]|uniref:hypothetical protein n=1 Tax=Streptomyces sp. ERV7 TaxID=1322334 RepID=UPI0007F3F92E|nr:hypothetical protein [Streptomyces sp. ERV7]OAR26605.1 hypothetical protein A8W25_28320 [Streptomyces sp. ERV7]
MHTGRIRRAAAATLLSCGLATGTFATAAAAAPAHDQGDGHDRGQGSGWSWDAHFSGWIRDDHGGNRPWDDHGGGWRWDDHDHDRGHSRDHHDDGRVWGTVTSRIELNVRDNPSLRADVVVALSPGSRTRIECRTHGENVNGTSTWYWLRDAGGWATAAFVRASGDVPNC